MNDFFVVVVVSFRFRFVTYDALIEGLDHVKIYVSTVVVACLVVVISSAYIYKIVMRIQVFHYNSSSTTRHILQQR